MLKKDGTVLMLSQLDLDFATQTKQSDGVLAREQNAVLTENLWEMPINEDGSLLVPN